MLHIKFKYYFEARSKEIRVDLYSSYVVFEFCFHTLFEDTLSQQLVFANSSPPVMLWLEVNSPPLCLHHSCSLVTQSTVLC